MADTERVARRLRQFAEAVGRLSHGGGQQRVDQPRASGSKTPEELRYERCVAQLDPDEQDKLDEMIEKMFGAVGPP
jgi:ABC-type arginine transport system ATPase subunit